MVNFIPEPVSKPNGTVPYFEDSQLLKIPGRGTEKSADKLQAEIRELMLKLGARNVVFTAGTFPAAPGMPLRYGWLMTFTSSGLNGRMEIAALPLRHETPATKRNALEQALYLVRNWLEGEVFSEMYRPGAVPLIPFLIGTGGKTITEALIDSTDLPLITSGSR